MATRLLLADDSITIQKVVELVLAEEGFEIKPTNNGEEAYQALDSFGPDIVLADIEMPRMNGYQLCEKIRQNPKTAAIPVILLAGAFEPLDEELAKKVGATDFIIKPFESQDLIAKINGALSVKPASAQAPALAEESVEEAYAVPEEGEAGEDLWAMEGIEGGEEALEAVTETGEEPQDAFTIDEETLAVEAVEEETDIEKPVAIPERPVSAGDVTDAVSLSVSKVVVDAMKKVDMREVILSAIGPELKKMTEAFVRESAPRIMESLVKDVMKEVSAGMKKDIEKIIWETVPDLAESIIKKEIESIKSEI